MPIPVPDYSVLVVDDFEGFRRFVCQALARRSGFRITQASDGLEAVCKAEELQPDLVLLDIALPKLNGLEAGRRIRRLCPGSKIIFLSQESSPDIVMEALRLGGQGYVHKTRAGTDLLAAIDAVFNGKHFLSENLELSDQTDARPLRRHEVLFYSDDSVLVDSLARFITAALNAGQAAIVVGTPSLREGLPHKLLAEGVDIAAAIELGRCVFVDSKTVLSAFMVNDWPDATRLSKVAGDIVQRAAKASEGGRVVVCGECAPVLLALGHTEAAIRIEQLWDEIVVRKYGADTLCVYPRHRGHEGDPTSQRICAEHSAVSFR